MWKGILRKLDILSGTGTANALLKTVAIINITVITNCFLMVKNRIVLGFARLDSLSLCPPVLYIAFFLYPAEELFHCTHEITHDGEEVWMY